MRRPHRLALALTLFVFGVSVAAMALAVLLALVATGDGFVVTVDVSENRVAFDVGGPAARDLLEGGITVDLHPRVFVAGSCAQTLLARASVLLWQRTDDPSYRLFVRPSFSAYVEAWLEDGRAALGW